VLLSGDAVRFLCALVLAGCSTGIYVPDPPVPGGQPPTGGTGGTGGNTMQPPPSNASPDELQALLLVNNDRAAHPTESCGGAPLHWNDALAAVARQHSQAVAQTGNFDHNDANGSPFDRMTKAGITYSTAGENMAQGGNPQEAEQLLMSDPPHRSLIMSCDMTDIGIGIAAANGTLIVTQDFIHP
jgi:uncharacterized protein YkwD